MLNKVSDNCYQFEVNVRESFTYFLDFDKQSVIIDYFCKTDNYHFITTYSFKDFRDKEHIDSKDFEELAILVHASITKYLHTNVISGSIRRAFMDFKQQLCSLYSNFNIAQMLIV